MQCDKENYNNCEASTHIQYINKELEEVKAGISDNLTKLYDKLNKIYIALIGTCLSLTGAVVTGALLMLFKK